MTTLTVGSGNGYQFSTLADAIAAASSGDVIQVEAGTYTNDFATITTNLTIEGVGGMVNLVATIPPANLQGILTIGTPGTTGPAVALDNISFSGAAISDADGGNAAGIRYASGNLTLNNDFFFDNQDGLLADADPTGTITINNSEFVNNGNPGTSSGTEHNLYVGAIQQLTIADSYFYDPVVGHDIKSRAANNLVENSTIADPNGTGGYEIDLPNGRNDQITDNVIEKGPGAQNSNFIAFGEEGSLYAGSSLTVSGNTFINGHGGNANAVLNPTGIPVSFTDNTLYGFTSAQVSTGPVDSLATDLLEPLPGAPALATPPFVFTPACFAAGARIMTDSGFLPIEALRPGQRVVVVGPGETAPPGPAYRRIAWIGHCSIDLKRHPAPDLVRPIRILANAFADAAPVRDLLVSPDHAIAVNGLLIQARLLQNGATILREDRLQRVRYFHLELDRHDLVLAEGLAAESYLDTGNRGSFENAGIPIVLHPDLAGGSQQARRELLSCIPFAADVARVEPEWRRLALRASQLGFAVIRPATVSDPALHLEIDGRPHLPVSNADRRFVFSLPRMAAAVRISSRSGAPCDVSPWIDDRRQLGVAVGRIVFSGPDGVVERPVDDPSLRDGWWGAERDGTRLWRWTTGSAGLPVPPGAAILTIHLAGSNPFQCGKVTSSADHGSRLQAA